MRRSSPPDCRALLFALVLGLSLAVAACSTPAQRFSEHAAALGMRAEVIAEARFQHLVLFQSRRPSRTLHIYLDGDGTPWLLGGPADDPTPRNPLVLELMALDPYPSIYLGRPCYHGFSQTTPCLSALWTQERYSEAVVTSMEAALRRMLRDGEFNRVAWFGYSGGGALAVLLAPRFTETTAVVTVAANLEIDAWADLHGYPRLVGSLNPARQPPMPARIYRRHLAGGRDRVVPKEIVARGLIDHESLTVFPSFDHTCCWYTIWPEVLTELDRAIDSGP